MSDRGIVPIGAEPTPAAEPRGDPAADRGVEVVTDSTSYLPHALVESLGIKVVSLYWDLGDGSARELDAGDDHGGFFAALERAANVATTHPPSVEDFLAVYEPALASGRDVVSVHISAGMSRTCAHAEAAARRLEAGERVRVIDSAATGGQLGLLAMVAGHAARGGGGTAAIAERVMQARHEARTWFLVDTLEYLRRGGRVGTAIAWVGSTLNIKPIIEAGTELRAVERVRTRERGIERIIDFARRQADLGADAWYATHTRAQPEARALADRLLEVFGRPPEFVCEMGPVVGTHTGPGVVGIGAMPSRYLDGSA